MRNRLPASLCLAALLVFSASSLAFAHAELLRSEPAADARLAEPPDRVALWFDEELDTRKSTLAVLNRDYRQVDVGDGRVDLNDPDHAAMLVSLPRLPEGVYVVRWHAVTIDDDGVTEGEYDFIVGNAAAHRKPARAELSPVAILAAGILTAALIVAAGLAWRAAKH